MDVYFVIIGEGTSDDGLVPHLERLCVECGADVATGNPIDYSRISRKVGRDVVSKVRAVAELEPSANLLFIHRDSDARDSRQRYAEIELGIEEAGITGQYVSVVPVQEIEAWLLLDETAIRRVAQNPRATHALDLPAPRSVENVASPKERLKSTLARASGLHGHRLAKFKRNFPSQRRQLLQQLEPGGELVKVASWRRLERDVRAAIAKLMATEE